MKVSARLVGAELSDSEAIVRRISDRAVAALRQRVAARQAARATAPKPITPIKPVTPRS